MIGSSATTLELTEVVDELEKLILQVRYDWQTFKAMYADSEHVSVFNKTAPGFFAMHQQRLTDTSTLAIARLFDPAYTGTDRSKTNLTLYALVDLLDGVVDDVFRDRIKDRVDSVKLAIKPLIAQRHKRIAHLDRATLLGANLLPSSTMLEYNVALTDIESILNDVCEKLSRPQMMFDFLDDYPNADVKQLVVRLMAAHTLRPHELLKRQAQYKQQADQEAQS